MDTESFTHLTKMGASEIIPIALNDFEQGDNLLIEAKQNRTTIEYYFTCTPSLPLFVFKHYNDVEQITYLDADLFFFADPNPLFLEMGDASISIIEHRFPPHLSSFRDWGIYNVGWLSFRRDKNADECLSWWRERCIDWCYDRVEPTRCADQKYLDNWPKLFHNVCVLENAGANVAPWNVSRYRIRYNNNHVLIDDHPLLFYHFHALKRICRNIYDTGIHKYHADLTNVLARQVYAPYIRSLEKQFINLKSTAGIRHAQIDSSAPPLWRKLVREALVTTRSIPEFAKKKLLFVGPLGVWH